MLVANLDYQPKVFVETEGLTEPEWLEWRRKGIGGSDAAAAMDLSPWKTSRDLYWNKLGIESNVDAENNWVQLEVGHRLEELVAMIFKVKTGFRIFVKKIMYQHPLYPFMLADLDFLIELPDKSLAILECKTCGWNVKDKWWDDQGREIVPAHYEAQGRHYMSVMNLDHVYFCCLYGNRFDDVIIRHIERDYGYEEEMIYVEKNLWENHIIPRVTPPLVGRGELVLNAVQKHYGAIDSAALVELDPGNAEALNRYLKLQEQKQALDAQSRGLKDQMDRIKASILDKMQVSGSAMCKCGDNLFTVKNSVVQRTGIDKDGLAQLQALYPEVYEQFIKVSESRRFQVELAVKKEVA